MDTPLNHDDFSQCLVAAGAPSTEGSQELFKALLNAWSEPQRKYHTLQHLAECLTLSTNAAEELPAKDLAAVRLALWFHDGVYDVQAHDNEEKSAAWAGDALSALALPPEAVTAVVDLVLATRHLGKHEPARSPSIDWMLDIDLAILGAQPGRFAEYDGQIQAEYSWVPADQYKTGRAAVLDAFLRKALEGKLYRTGWAQRELQPQAIVNLTPQS